MSNNLHIKHVSTVLLILTCCIIYITQGLAQSTNITGEEEFFFKGKGKSNINLGFDLLLSQTSQYYSKLLLSPNKDEMFQVGFSLRGYFPITRKIVARIHFPYLYKAGIKDDENYPNSADVFPGMSNYQKNYGVGDLSAVIAYTVLSRPFNLVTQLEGIAATAKNRFDSSYDGYLPLGNGFHALSLGSGISRRLFLNTLLFASGGYVLRFPRNFDPTDYNDGNLLNGKKYAPDNIYFLRAGISFYVMIFSRYKQVINLETEYIKVGAVKLDDSHFKVQPIVESPFAVIRFGIKSVIRREKGVSTTLFIGVENKNYDGNKSLLPIKDKSNTFIVIANLPMMFKFFNFDLHKN